jgi:hypothetical protein
LTCDAKTESPLQPFSSAKVSVNYIVKTGQVHVLSMYDTSVSNLGAILMLRRKISDRLVAARSTRSEGTPSCDVADASVLRYPAKRRTQTLGSWKKPIMKAVCVNVGKRWIVPRWMEVSN